MLTNAAVKAAIPATRAFKLFDSGGLHLFVAPTGLRAWRMKYQRGGRERLLSFGHYPDVSLAVARERRDAARAAIRRGEDPAADRHGPGGVAFEQIARAWHAHQQPHWTPVHAADVLTSLERDVFPAIGAKSLDGIDPPAVLKLLRVVERRGCRETAQRLRQRVSSVFNFAISEGTATINPAAVVGGALTPPGEIREHRAIEDVEQARALFAAIAAADGAAPIRLAAALLALTAVRLAAVRGARWEEFEGVDWATGAAIDPLWRVPAARMKLRAAKKGDAKFDHLVPLSAAAVAVLRAARGPRFSDALVFPGRDRAGPIGKGSIGALIDRLGFGDAHVPHGWRASFSTILNERFFGDRDAIDRALAHADKNKVEGAYNRAKLIERRRWLFDRWAELLTGEAGTDPGLIGG